METIDRYNFLKQFFSEDAFVGLSTCTKEIFHKMNEMYCIFKEMNLSARRPYFMDISPGKPSESPKSKEEMESPKAAVEMEISHRPRYVSAFDDESDPESVQEGNDVIRRLVLAEKRKSLRRSNSSDSLCSVEIKRTKSTKGKKSNETKFVLQEKKTVGLKKRKSSVKISSGRKRKASNSKQEKLKETAAKVSKVLKAKDDAEKKYSKPSQPNNQSASHSHTSSPESLEELSPKRIRRPVVCMCCGTCERTPVSPKRIEDYRSKSVNRGTTISYFIPKKTERWSSISRIKHINLEDKGKLSKVTSVASQPNGSIESHAHSIQEQLTFVPASNDFSNSSSSPISFPTEQTNLKEKGIYPEETPIASQPQGNIGSDANEIKEQLTHIPASNDNLNAVCSTSTNYDSFPHQQANLEEEASPKGTPVALQVKGYTEFDANQIQEKLNYILASSDVSSAVRCTLPMCDSLPQKQTNFEEEETSLKEAPGASQTKGNIEFDANKIQEELNCVRVSNNISNASCCAFPVCDSSPQEQMKLTEKGNLPKEASVAVQFISSMESEANQTHEPLTYVPASNYISNCFSTSAICDSFPQKHTNLEAEGNLLNKVPIASQAQGNTEADASQTQEQLTCVSASNCISNGFCSTSPKCDSSLEKRTNFEEEENSSKETSIDSQPNIYIESDANQMQEDHVLISITDGPKQINKILNTVCSTSPMHDFSPQESESGYSETVSSLLSKSDEDTCFAGATEISVLSVKEG